MKKSISDFFAARKAEVAYRTDRTQAEFGAPQLSASPVVYEIAEKTSAVSHGGVAMIHQIAAQSGLIDRHNEASILLLQLPYFESDHLLNIAYNFLCGGTALDKRKAQTTGRRHFFNWWNNCDLQSTRGVNASMPNVNEWLM